MFVKQYFLQIHFYFSHDPFEEFFGRFHYQDQDITLFHKLSVTTRYNSIYHYLFIVNLLF